MDFIKVNAHLHTPYSFSAFYDVNDALDRAVAENVKVVGINDFYTTAGYDEWFAGCEERHLYPLFNIEFISLNENDQKNGLRVNDPSNPGRTYISGKGLKYPFKLSQPYSTQLAEVRKKSNDQVEAMCKKLNELLDASNISFRLNFDWIRNDLTKGDVRERHLAKALRLKVYETAQNDESRIREMLQLLFGSVKLKALPSNIADVENEIRANLLKAGGVAFVPEETDAFLSVSAVFKIILNAGGIPTYPFLADDKNGNYTDFENDLEQVTRELKKRGFHSVEFIATRNDVQLLEKYAEYLYDAGFVVTFGSEHNSPTMEPIELFARSNTPLTDKLMKINYEGACVIAAHQHLISDGKQGYVDSDGNAHSSQIKSFIEMGDALIQK
ncbi:MAG: hypothetical protein PHI32_09825 [Dysgonamonadaceae bacterium]|nr:hypothetical protein [Dysgonamonadaceae bacterium]MDD4727956.1 hypothetical protein [Dysgonamonadaceae bacterium]